MFKKSPLKVDYQGKPMLISEVARLEGCNPRAVYRWFYKYGSLDGFHWQKQKRPRRILFEGEHLTFREIAIRMGKKPSVVRDFYRMHGTLEGIGMSRKGRPLPQLEKFYHTLDPTIPLDRCIAAAGYRSIHQFCKANNLSASLLGRWRQGKLYMLARRIDDLPPLCRPPTLLDEMTNFGNGFSVPLYKLMEGTGCLEWELFPNIFTQDYYNGVYKGLQDISARKEGKDIGVERREQRGVVRAVLNTLPNPLREVVELSLGIGPTYEELTYDAIGRRFGVSRERIRQMLAKAMKILMKSSHRARLEEVSPFPVDQVRTIKDAMNSIRTMKWIPIHRRGC